MRYRLRTLLLLMVAAAIFFGGYRLGWQHGRDSRFDELIRLITASIAADSGWGREPGPVSGEPEAQAKAPSEPVDPFASPPSPLAADDPFAAPQSAP